MTEKLPVYSFELKPQDYGVDYMNTVNNMFIAYQTGVIAFNAQIDASNLAEQYAAQAFADANRAASLVMKPLLQIRQSVVSNPLFSLFDSNDIESKLIGELSHARTTTQSTTDRYGLVVNAPVNLAIETDSGWPCFGASTNFLLHSNDINNDAWEKNNVSFSENVLEAPDGTVTAGKLVETDSVAGHYLLQQQTANVTLLHTFSVFIRKSERTKCVLRLDSVSSNGYEVAFDLQNNQVTSSILLGSAAQESVIIEELANEWLRLSLSCIPDTSGANSVVRGIVYINDGSYMGDVLKGIYLWNFDMVQGSLSPHINTASIATTRTADSFSFDVYNNIPRLSKKWSLSLWLIGLNSSFQCFEHSDSQFGLLVSNNDLTLVNNAGIQYQIAVDVNFTMKTHCALTFDGQTLRTYINGGLQSSIVPAVNDISTGTIIVGNNQAFTNPLYGYISKFYGWDKSLTPDEIEYISGA